MSDFIRLEQALRSSTILAATVCLILLLVTISSLAFAIYAVLGAHRALARMPVLVVPGAVAGVYTPGLTEENIRAAARYIASLGSSFTGVRNMDQRFDELESFASPEFLPRLQAARSMLRRDVETQDQARAFYSTPSSEILTQTVPGHFEYGIRGQRVVYASGLTMDARSTQLNLKLALGTPSDKNRVGVVLDGFDVVDENPGTHPLAVR